MWHICLEVNPVPIAKSLQNLMAIIKFLNLDGTRSGAAKIFLILDDDFGVIKIIENCFETTTSKLCFFHKSQVQFLTWVTDLTTLCYLSSIDLFLLANEG